MNSNIDKPSLTKKHFDIYGAQNCPNCIKAKDALDMSKCNYTYYDIGKKEDGAFIEFFFEFKHLIPDNHRTVPVIFYENIFIGGYTQLCRFLTDNEDLFLEKDDLELEANF